jgi:hypothetical protein
VHRRPLAVVSIAAIVSCAVPNGTFNGQYDAAPIAATVPAAGSPPAASVFTYQIPVNINNGEKQRIDFIVFLNPDCTIRGYSSVKITTPPTHGLLTTEAGRDYPHYAKGNQRYPCNLTQTDGVNVYYRSNPGYTGSDLAVVQSGPPPGDIGYPITENYLITVGSQTTVAGAARPPSTRQTVANSGQKQRIGQFWAVSPDCISLGYGNVRTINPPGHGVITVESGRDYPNFPKENARSACNSKKVGLLNIYYKSNPGYVGVDQARIEEDPPPGAGFSAVYRIVDYVITVR